MSAKPATKPSEVSDADQNTALAAFDAYAGAMTVGEMPDWMENSNRGNESVGAEDVQIPRLEIIQDISPILKTDDKAEVGMLFNSVTNEIYGDRVLFVPVMFIKQWLVWKDRKAGGGFRGAFYSEMEAKDRLMEAVDEGENAKSLAIAETPTHIGYIITGGTPDNPKLMQIAISMPRSKIKISKRLNAMVQMSGGDRFARVYEISTTPETSAQGTFANFAFTPKGWTPRVIYEKAAEMYSRINNGTVINVAHESASDGSEGNTDNTEF